MASCFGPPTTGDRVCLVCLPTYHILHAIASLLTQLASAKLQQSHYAFGKVLEELQS
jgi:hypothetical protein